MGKAAYIGVSSKARKVKKAYIGVDGKARKIKKMYIGDANGKARLFWSGGGDRFFLSYIMSESPNITSFKDYSVESFKEGEIASRTKTTLSHTVAGYSPAFTYCVDGIYYVFIEGYYGIVGVYYSTDLTSWTYCAMPSTIHNETSYQERECTRIYYANGRFIAFVEGFERLVEGSTTNYRSLYCYESTDAKTWTQRGNVLYKQASTSSLTQPVKLEYGNVEGSPAYFLIAGGGRSYNYDYYSRDLNTWTKMTYIGDNTFFATCTDDTGDIFHLYSLNGTGSNNLWVRNLNTGTRKSCYYTSRGDHSESCLVSIDGDNLGYITIHMNTTGYYMFKVGKPDNTASSTMVKQGQGYPIRDRGAKDCMLTKHNNTFYWVKSAGRTQVSQSGYAASNLILSTSNDFSTWTDTTLAYGIVRTVTTLEFEKNL